MGRHAIPAALDPSQVECCGGARIGTRGGPCLRNGLLRAAHGCAGDRQCDRPRWNVGIGGGGGSRFRRDGHSDRRAPRVSRGSRVEADGRLSRLEVGCGLALQRGSDVTRRNVTRVRWDRHGIAGISAFRRRREPDPQRARRAGSHGRRARGIACSPTVGGYH